MRLTKRGAGVDADSFGLGLLDWGLGENHAFFCTGSVPSVFIMGPVARWGTGSSFGRFRLPVGMVFKQCMGELSWVDDEVSNSTVRSALPTVSSAACDRLQ